MFKSNKELRPIYITHKDCVNYIKENGGLSSILRDYEQFEDVEEESKDNPNCIIILCDLYILDKVSPYTLDDVLSDFDVWSKTTDILMKNPNLPVVSFDFSGSVYDTGVILDEDPHSGDLTLGTFENRLEVEALDIYEVLNKVVGTTSVNKVSPRQSLITTIKLEGFKLKTDTYSSSAGFGEGEPEDMTLGRDLSDAYNIEDMLIEAYEAGKRGEPIEIINVSEE